ncbi:hypothetical protein LLG95_14235 [bacterium]|nr:hypothetical protein [bacterium]
MEQLFLGNEQMTVDQKGRVGIPSRFMSVLRALEPADADKVGVMITPDRSIKIMPAGYFRSELESWSKLDDRDSQERMILNLATSLAELVTLDKQNRIKLNPMMAELAGIDRQVVIVGNIKFMQLFDAKTWREMFEKSLPAWGEAATQLARRGDKPQPIQYVINAPGVQKP